MGIRVPIQIYNSTSTSEFSMLHNKSVEYINMETLNRDNNQTI